ncbi:MAG: ComF family protein [Clostridia bacterium]|nr:ComF family protein [Clostridia bacterium]
MKIKEILKRMFIERDCIVCGEPISYDNIDYVCEDCEEDWYNLLTTRCNSCGNERDLCFCLPNLVKEINDSLAIWCVFYDKEKNPNANRIFFDLKKKGYRSVVKVMAEYISKVLISYCYAHNIKYKTFAITYVPRRKSMRRYYSFDQSEKLAKALGKLLNLPTFSCLDNKGRKEQKKLNKYERLENARKSYQLKKNAKVEYKNIFLLDDIITSGASMRACAEILYDNGAKSVIPVAFAKDNYKKGE